MGRRQDWALWDLKLVIEIAVAVALLLPPLPSTADWIVEKEEPCISHGTMFNFEFACFSSLPPILLLYPPEERCLYEYFANHRFQ